MIYEITKEVAADFAAKGVPFRVEYGPETTVTSAIVDTRVVIERDRRGGDQSGPPRSEQANPRRLAVRAIGCVARVYAKSSKVGAGVHMHERLADQLVDALECALYKIVKQRRTMWRIASAKLLTADEIGLRGLEKWPGVVYEMTFSIDRGVMDTNWAGEGREEAELEGVSSTTNVRQAPGFGAVETACGG